MSEDFIGRLVFLLFGMFIGYGAGRGDAARKNKK